MWKCIQILCNDDSEQSPTNINKITSSLKTEAAHFICAPAASGSPDQAIAYV